MDIEYSQIVETPLDFHEAAECQPLPCWCRGRELIPLEELPLFQLLKKKAAENPGFLDRDHAAAGAGRGRPINGSSHPIPDDMSDSNEDFVGAYWNRQKPLRAPTFNMTSKFVEADEEPNGLLEKPADPEPVIKPMPRRGIADSWKKRIAQMIQPLAERGIRAAYSSRGAEGSAQIGQPSTEQHISTTYSRRVNGASHTVKPPTERCIPTAFSSPTENVAAMAPPPTKKDIPTAYSRWAGEGSAQMAQPPTERCYPATHSNRAQGDHCGDFPKQARRPPPPAQRCQFIKPSTSGGDSSRRAKAQMQATKATTKRGSFDPSNFIPPHDLSIWVASLSQPRPCDPDSDDSDDDYYKGRRIAPAAEELIDELDSTSSSDSSAELTDETGSSAGNGVTIAKLPEGTSANPLFVCVAREEERRQVHDKNGAVSITLSPASVSLDGTPSLLSRGVPWRVFKCGIADGRDASRLGQSERRKSGTYFVYDSTSH